MARAISRSRHEAVIAIGERKYSAVLSVGEEAIRVGWREKNLREAGESVAPSHSWLGCVEIPARSEWNVSEAGQG